MTTQEAIKKIREIYSFEEEFETAIEALEKQIPRKPQKTNDIFSCSVCGMDVFEKVENYCAICGQKLDWSD